MPKLRVLLVDDHTVVRQGLRKILESDDEIEIVGEAGDGRTAVDMVQRMRPHVVVMDVALPELNGIEATRQITKRVDGAKVLVLTMHSDDVYVRQSLKAGARGYLLKDSEDLDLIKAVKAVGQGGSFFSPSVSKVLLAGYLGDPTGKEVEDNLALLTDREREVLQLIAEGKTNKDVASLLNVSINTVETHRKHVMEKLDLHNTAELVRFAVRKKIVH
ncbi:MAG: response regulator transcription factor [bacterium]|jgi:two-component system response regulator NreC|nr:response regulator transcription factor [bacterium]